MPNRGLPVLAGRYYGVEQHWTRVVRNGGVAIVQYNTPEYDNNFGPYPYVMRRNPRK